MVEELKNTSWETNGTPHSVIMLKDGDKYIITYSNGYYGDVDGDEVYDYEEALKVFDWLLEDYKPGNGFQF